MATEAMPNDEQAALAYETIPSPGQDVINMLVYDYLIHNCYSSTARSFGTACRLDKTDVDSRVLGDGVTPVLGHGDKLESYSSSSLRSKENLGLRAKTCMDIDQETSMTITDSDGDLTMAESSLSRTQHFMPAASVSTAAPASCTFTSKSIADSCLGKTDRSAFKGSLQTLEVRGKLYRLILNGKLTEAIALCNETFPGILNADTPESMDVYFALQCQQFIECIRRSALEALHFAQEEFGKFAFKNDKYNETLQDIVALIAYTNPETSPLSKYMAKSRNEQVAMALNSYILAFHGSPSHTSLERLVAHVTVLREQLHADSSKEKKVSGSAVTKSRSDSTTYPRWQLSSFLPQ
ncbi:hypothetical protein BATDEDRAFT_89572 [Batrachochytrium dendrobatidis JAM81]|uniref:CTLH domain-containing protein n=2 Tax=Batrachochytrium dendrobatidis TaxID=109871 RepID=F4P5W7_BATDJ|nr:uncharacterized protein BATDEDRAFT_89572 [Batrachochytrium dendrobatidis JAM81]EGF79498.1 hypothetical protein BATDEDRAFT_89572 [Batrachochytrium dendrobatidis JAM81]KAJ8322853.1 hypothetical protein O5D80_008381 [Batrachochytrium dendrobatidis]KAK5665830.1 hypothetical protein QVD99_007458 [Batrachochytrium dendrobatidis]OAJ42768.1 hypothetical protein BDEG_26182 [Batrachochytrium dendrobatidis JEL423]|eukprot:XP_006680178.1 hypothetical protein BATDEDRAFT_89572 [Batrachochytrium dendrobatidis JAM81]